jgi:hypothetical protein
MLGRLDLGLTAPRASLSHLARRDRPPLIWHLGGSVRDMPGVEGEEAATGTWNELLGRASRAQQAQGHVALPAPGTGVVRGWTPGT